MSRTDQTWVEGPQPRYRITRNMKMHVSNMPPIIMNLSWVARLSISLITVLESPSMLATSSIFLWVPCVEQKRPVISNSSAGVMIIIYTDGSLGMPTPCLTRQRFLMVGLSHCVGASQQSHPDKRGLKPNQEAHLLPGNKDSPSS